MQIVLHGNILSENLFESCLKGKKAISGNLRLIGHYAQREKPVRNRNIFKNEDLCCFRFQSDDRHLPVLWHQCLLVFVQRYKEDMSTEQKESIMKLLKKHTHDKITPEIRRELLHSTCRDEETAEPPME